MDNQTEIERLGNVCTDLKKTIEEDLEKRKHQDRSDKVWQVTTLFLPILMTAGVGLFLSNGQARLQESIASSVEFNQHQLARYETLDNLAIGLQKTIDDLTAASQDGSEESGDSLNAAVNALKKIEEPLSGLYFDDDLVGPVKNIIDGASNNQYLSGGSANSDSVAKSVRELGQLLKKKLAAKAP